MTPDRDDLLAYALGTLSPVEAARVEAELDRDPALRAELRADLDALALLLDDIDPQAVPVPAGAGEELLTRVRAEESQAGMPSVSGAAPTVARPPRRWPVAVALAAALALVFALLPRPNADPLEAYRTTPGAVERTLEVGGERVGTLVQLPEGRVYVHLSRPLPPERTYQLWRIEGSTPVSLGVFERGLLVTLAPGSTLAVSVEPPGGSPQPTTTPLFVQSL